LLFFAALAGKTEVVRELLSQGGVAQDINRGISRPWKHLAGCIDGAAPLTAALAFGNFDVVDLLLASRADPLQRVGFGADHLMLACMVGNVANVKCWLKRFPEWDLSRPDFFFRYNALFSAVGIGQNKQELVRVLLAARAGIQHINAGGGTLLTSLAQKEFNDIATLELLLGAGCSLNQQCQPGSFKAKALCRAAQMLAKCTHRSRLVADLAMIEGSTPLHFAAKRGDVDLVTALLSARALPLRNRQGHTPLDAARNFFRELPEPLAAAMSLREPSESRPCPSQYL